MENQLNEYTIKDTQLKLQAIMNNEQSRDAQYTDVIETIHQYYNTDYQFESGFNPQSVLEKERDISKNKIRYMTVSHPESFFVDMSRYLCCFMNDQEAPHEKSLVNLNEIMGSQWNRYCVHTGRFASSTLDFFNKARSMKSQHTDPMEPIRDIESIRNLLELTALIIFQQKPSDILNKITDIEKNHLSHFNLLDKISLERTLSTLRTEYEAMQPNNSVKTIIL